MNKLELARLSVFNLELRKEIIRNNIKYYTNQLEECIKRYIGEENRRRIERSLIKEENFLIKLEDHKISKKEQKQVWLNLVLQRKKTKIK